jgi:metal-responsive CopG/Arc/MetJ family transcriptional regulator
MPLLKRTYTLPPDTVGAFEDAVDAGKRSAVVAALLQEWLERRRAEELRRDVIEGCQAMAAIYLEVEQEFHTLEEEVHRALEP